MGALLIAAALAQVGAGGGSATPGSGGATAPSTHKGQSTYVEI